jgi:hypothetical protein
VRSLLPQAVGAGEPCFLHQLQMVGQPTDTVEEQIVVEKERACFQNTGDRAVAGGDQCGIAQIVDRDRRHQSGNPGGRTRALAEVMGLAREASPRAIQRMIELIDSDDERVALMAAEKVLERAWGKPREAVPENRVKDMTPEQRRQRFCEILAFAAQLKVPEAIPHTNGADHRLEEAVDPLDAPATVG